MGEVEITVRGRSSSAHPPERATVYLHVSIEGATRDGVFGAVNTSAATIAAQLGPLVDPERGPVTTWSADQVRTWSERPGNDSGRQLPHVHHAAVDFRVTFADFAALSRWISTVVPLPGVNVSHLDWTLTDARRVQLIELTRDAAVADAVAKARSYARSLGLGEVRPVAIADLGMLDGGQLAEPSMRYAAASFARDGGEAVLDFTPQDVTLDAAVDARFRAG